MNLTSPSITVIAALITAIAAIIAPSVTAYINNRYQYKIKTIDLFFNAKLEAYQRFIKAASYAASNPSMEVQKALDDSMSYALLLSSRPTQVLLLKYTQALIHSSDANRIGDLQAKTILSMQKDLYEFRKYRKIHKETPQEQS